MADANYTLKTLDGSTIEVFMSFGLLNTLVRIVKDPDVIVQLPFLHDVRDEFLDALVQVRSKTGMLLSDERNKLENMQVAPTVIVDLLAWAEEHVLDFFISQATKLHKINQKNDKSLKALTPSTPG